MELPTDSNVLTDYIAERFSDAQIKMLNAIFEAALNINNITKIETLGYNSTAIVHCNLS